MRLTFHQFRKDLRQFRILLLVWFLMLLLDLSVNLGWLGVGAAPNWQNGEYRSELFDFQVFMQTAFRWVLFFLIPSVVVLADSPGRREGFLRTRPLPGRNLFWAKALFVVTLVLVPALLQELIYLSASGVSAGYVLHGVLERLLYALPMVTIAAAFASLWRNYARWAAGAAIALVGTLLCLSLLNILCLLTGHLDAFDHLSDAATGSRTLAGLYFFSLAATAVAVGHARRTWGAAGRWLGIAAAILVYLTTITCWPQDFFKLVPADPVAARSVAAQSPFDVPLQQIQLGRSFDQHWLDRLDFWVNVTPQITNSIAPNLIEWSGRQVQLANAAGQTFTPDRPPGISSSRQSYGNPPSTDLNIWAGLLPKEAIFLLSPSTLPAGASTSLGEFHLDARAAWLRGPVTLHARLEGRVYRWDKVAELAVNTPATVKDPYGAWTMVAFHPVIKHQNGSQTPVAVLLKRSQIGFATATDARTAAFQNGPRERYDFVLYQPGRNLVLVPDSSYPAATRAGDTALEQYWLNLSFSQRFGATKSFTPEEWAECQLLIFQRTWLGTVPADWQSPGLVINDLLAPADASQQAGSAAGQGVLPLGEVRRRLAELPVPGPAASRVEVGHYLFQVALLLNANNTSYTLGEAASSRLASLAPDHLEVLLAGLSAIGNPAKTTLLQAINSGVTESQKARIIAALPENPDLLEVVLNRGWEADAHDAIYKLMASPQPLSYQAIQAIASFHDPATYPRLLAAFEAAPGREVYDLLRTLPGLAQPLSEAVARQWQNPVHFLSGNGQEVDEQALSLGLHTGSMEALRFAYRMLAETEPGDDSSLIVWPLAQSFFGNVRMDGLKIQDRQSHPKVLDWMRQYKPEDFVFDPVRQCFYLKNER